VANLTLPILLGNDYLDIYVGITCTSDKISRIEDTKTKIRWAAAATLFLISLIVCTLNQNQPKKIMHRSPGSWMKN